MDFELRKLKSDDLFLMFAILSKIGFREFKQSLTPDKVKELTSAFKQEDGQKEDMTTFLGINIMFDVVEFVMKGLPSCKVEIYNFLSSLSGMAVKEISNLDIAAFTEMVVAVIQKDEFKDFFKAVAKLFK